VILTRTTCVTATVCLVLSWGSMLTTAIALRTPSQKQPAKPKPTKPSAKADPALVTLGKKVYEKQGCATCHAIEGKGGNAGPDLTATGAVPSHTVAWFAVQVANPKAHTPSSTMPAYAQSIKGKEMTALTTYLASLKGTAAAPTETATSGRKTVAPSDPAAIAKIEKMGALIGTIAQNDDRLEVSFHMLGSKVTDKDIAILSSLKGLAHLDLGQTSITDAGLAHLKGLKDLTRLHLEGTKITDAGLVNLKELHNLTYLNLYGTNITDVGLEHLSPLTKLKDLYLWQTKVTEAGVSKLKKALPQVEIVLGWDASPKP
jgi:mono/diheme cytochrome c family protein